MATIDRKRLELIVEILKAKKVEHFLNFYSYTKDGITIIEEHKYPSINEKPERVINFFFGATVQDFGFWLSDENGYKKPLYGMIEGKPLKGADFLWAKSMQMFKKNPDFFEPSNLANLSVDEAKEWFSDDSGEMLFQDFETRLRLSRAYARALENLMPVSREFGSLSEKREVTPSDIVAVANESDNPLRTLLKYLKIIPGYQEDPLQKKASLLAMILSNRPEHFLKVGQISPDWRPIVDYHLMRVSLRTGIVKAPEYEEKLTARKWLDWRAEADIRISVYRAILDIISLSGKTMAEIDFLFWSGRRYCPEMEKPDCEKCLFNPACEKNISLFQPIYRTTFY